MDYLDFEIEINPGTGGIYPISVMSSEAGEMREKMHFPFNENELQIQLLALENALLRSGSLRRDLLAVDQQDDQRVQNFGRELFNAMFTGKIGARYEVLRDKARTQGKGVRLKLHIQVPELAALPWEFLYDENEKKYICLSSDTPLVRYPELAQSTQSLPVKGKLSVLVMTANPLDLPALKIQDEKQRLEEALKGLEARDQVRVTWLEGHTWRDLLKAMRQGPWHIFHFIGHGGYDARTQTGLIALEDDEGKAHRLPAENLGILLADHNWLRLVVLNSCDGARAGERDVFSSTAATLIRSGIPAVLAMQYEITDRAAIELSRTFYDALADGLPIDTAVCEARKAIKLGLETSLEWGTPVLYTHSPDGVLFEMAHIPAQKTEKPPDTPAIPSPAAPRGSLPATPQESAVRPHPTPHMRNIFLIGLVLVLLLSGVLYAFIRVVGATTSNRGIATRTVPGPGATTSKRGIATRTVPDPNVDPNRFYTWATSGQPAVTESFLGTSTLNWVTNGGCTLSSDGFQVSGTPDLYNVCFAQGKSYGNFAFQANMSISKGQGGGLSFRGDGQNQYNFFVNADGTYLLSFGNANNGNTLIPKTGSVFIQQSDTLAAIARGSDIYLYVNQHFLTHFSDTSAQIGEIGLLAAGASTVVFNNLKIWQL